MHIITILQRTEKRQHCHKADNIMQYSPVIAFVGSMHQVCEIFVELVEKLVINYKLISNSMRQVKLDNYEKFPNKYELVQSSKHVSQ